MGVFIGVLVVGALGLSEPEEDIGVEFFTAEIGKIEVFFAEEFVADGVHGCEVWIHFGF